MRASWREDDGQALVEFALVLPIILLLLFGMLQFALVLNARQTVAYAAQAAANGYAQTLQRPAGDASARDAATQMRPEFARAGRVEYRLMRGGTESAIAADGVGAFGDLVVARVTYDYPSPIRAGIGDFRFPGTFGLSAEAVARVEASGGSAPGASAAPAPIPPTPAPPPPANAPVVRVPAACFTFSRVLSDPDVSLGAIETTSFTPGRTYWIRLTVTDTITRYERRTSRGSFGRTITTTVPVTERITTQVTGSFTAPAAGEVGITYAITARAGSRTAGVHVVGSARAC